MSFTRPVTRLESPARSWSFLLHLAGLCSFLASFAYITIFPQMPEGVFGGDFQFLTILGLALSLITFALGYGADLALSGPLYDTKNTLSVCVTPLEVLISLLYWGLRAIDKDLVIPPGLDFDLPLLADLGFHLAPAVFLTLDLLLFSPAWTIRAPNALALSGSLAVLYWAWVECCFSLNGFYPYPVFAILDTPWRMVLFGFSAMLMTTSTELLKWFYGLVNGSLVPLKEE